MTTKLKKIGLFIGALIVYLILMGLVICFTPILIPIVVYSSISYYFFKKEYKAYLQRINGTKFFCYNNRSNSKLFIENSILPMLSKDIKLIYLDGRTPKSKYDQKFISHALHCIKDRKGFPYLLKVSGGQLSDMSINNAFYNTMNQGKDISQLLSKINLFFQNELTH